jgi:hypothetical protein
VPKFEDRDHNTKYIIGGQGLDVHHDGKMDPNDPDDAQPHSSACRQEKNGKDWLALGGTDLAIQLFRKSPLPSFPPSGRQMPPLSILVESVKNMWKNRKINSEFQNQKTSVQ